MLCNFEKRVYKIVLTGAPGGGKSNCMRYIAESFEEMGYRVICVNETAKELYDTGLTINGEKEAILFNHAFIDLQKYKEDLYTNIAYGLKDAKVVILFDRGILDVAVFMGYQSFKNYLIERKIDINTLLLRYTGVIHLHTVAEYSFDVYNNISSTNPVRKEDAKKAFSMDKQYTELWNAFYEVKEVEAYRLFEDKVEKIKHIILDLINN